MVCAVGARASRGGQRAAGHAPCAEASKAQRCAALGCSKFARTYGSPTELSTEIEITHHALGGGGRDDRRGRGRSSRRGDAGPRRRVRERAGKEPGPGRPPRRRTRRPFGATLGRWSGRERLRALGSEGRGSHRALGGGGRDYRRGRGRSSRRSDPGAVNGTQADHGAGRRGYSRPGGEDGRPQAAAILARSMGPKPITERGGERIQASRRGRGGRGGHGRGWSVQADHGRGRGAPGRSRPGGERPC